MKTLDANMLEDQTFEDQAQDLEELAAYLDGRLTGERKARVEERLVRDEDFYEVFMATMEFQEEEAERDAEGPEKAKVVWWRSRKRFTPILVAASLTLVGSVYLFRNYQETRAWIRAAAAENPPMRGIWTLAQYFGDPPDAREWIEKIDPGTIVGLEGWYQPSWTRYRGDNIARDYYTAEQRAFRLGTRVVELEVALAAEDLAAVERLASMARVFAEASDLFAASSTYRTLVDQIRLLDQVEGVDPADALSADFDELIRMARAAEALIAEALENSPTESRHFRLGIWSEAGRLAAIGNDEKALRLVAIDSLEARKAPEIAAEVARIDQALEDAQSGGDLRSAREAFEGIAKKLGG